MLRLSHHETRVRTAPATPCRDAWPRDWPASVRMCAIPVGKFVPAALFSKTKCPITTKPSQKLAFELKFRGWPVPSRLGGKGVTKGDARTASVAKSGPRTISGGSPPSQLRRLIPRWSVLESPRRGENRSGLPCQSQTCQAPQDVSGCRHRRAIGLAVVVFPCRRLQMPSFGPNCPVGSSQDRFLVVVAVG